jgi:hypothetical protein
MPTMNDNFLPDIRLEGGKYTVRQTQAGLEALRYDKPWRKLTGDNLVYAMVVEILALRERLTPSDVKEFPDVSGWWWCRAKGDNFLPGDELCVEVIADTSMRASVLHGRYVQSPRLADSVQACDGAGQQTEDAGRPLRIVAMAQA